MKIFLFHEVMHPNTRRADAVKIRANTLSAAKRKATRIQTFQHTVLVITELNGAVVATKENGRWTDAD